ncbi:6-phosphogluconate dehydrogenase [Ordospora pajunii]|uniref:6-phosphogluconate dehydrogenase n=1 Tax=Ordospora pajunii TaxID=3039483 RepID=UPI00295284B0|nr:6-phosphogluconate dehydrogenase [Ordospora pajunii]KAH9412269.1 6-phosphogluconate dehydrogenase [Ordospora pajunii]
MAEVGLIGLGVMGYSLALNIASKCHKLHVFNRTSSKTKRLVGEDLRIIAHYSVQDLVQGISESPRIIILMVTSGDATDEFLDELDKYLGPGDVVIDGGNSAFKDTIRRGTHRFGFVGCGISGGETGARNGPSIMAGCKRQVWDVVGGFLCTISAVGAATGKPCCKWLGNDGAGHYVKMVHNGIEYADMGILSEMLLVLKSLGYSNEEMSRLFGEWNDGELESYLVKICSLIVKARNGKGWIIDQIVDESGQKGTGIEAVVSAMETGTPAVSIMEAVGSRMVSHARDARQEFGTMMMNGSDDVQMRGDGCINTNACKDALDKEAMRRCVYLARMVSHVQGFGMLMKARAKYGWEYTVADICDVWSSGCILRGRILDTIKEMGEGTNGMMELNGKYVSVCSEYLNDLRKVVMYGIENEVPMPVTSSCLEYVYGMKKVEGAGSMIQAMRDYFGAHQVLLKGESEYVHIDWDGEDAR